jgi:hypothetical protein
MGHSPAQSGNLKTSIRYMANPMPFPRAMVALACDIFKLVLFQQDTYILFHTSRQKTAALGNMLAEIARQC